MKKIVALTAFMLCSTVMAQAQDDAIVLRKIEADYKTSSASIDGADCSNNAVVLETAPEIAYTSVFSNGYTCTVHIIHKITYKLAGKTFHVLNRHQQYPKVTTFVVERDKK